MARAPDITDRLTLLVKSEHWDLADLVCADAVTEIQKLRDMLLRATPAVERVHALEPGGPKKSRWLVLLNELRKMVRYDD